MNLSWLYALSVVLVGFTLPIFSYLTLIYRELGRMTTCRVHEHLEIFEAEIEPKLKINRRSGGWTILNPEQLLLYVPLPGEQGRGGGIGTVILVALHAWLCH